MFHAKGKRVGSAGRWQGLFWDRGGSVPLVYGARGARARWRGRQGLGQVASAGAVGIGLLPGGQSGLLLPSEFPHGGSDPETWG